LDSLKKARALTVEKMARLPRRRLETLIKSSGFFRQKAERLQAFARYLLKHPEFHKALLGEPSSPGPFALPREKGNFNPLRNHLLSLKGIGPETADCILLYAGGYPSFVVDAYTRRIGQRLGLFKTNDYHEVQAFFADALPPKPAL